MQSQSRKIKRISLGLQSPVGSSTKVSKYTAYAKIGLPGFRANRVLN